MHQRNLFKLWGTSLSLGDIIEDFCEKKSSFL